MLAEFAGGIMKQINQKDARRGGGKGEGDRVGGERVGRGEGMSRVK